MSGQLPRFLCVQWGLLGEWWCVAKDLTDDEAHTMAAQIRERLGPDFDDCPLEYIEDRLFGGWGCADGDHRRHAYFATGCYSFLAAGEGRFWPMTPNDRCRQWETLLEGNPNNAPDTSARWANDATVRGIVRDEDYCRGAQERIDLAEEAQ